MLLYTHQETYISNFRALRHLVPAEFYLSVTKEFSHIYVKFYEHTHIPYERKVKSITIQFKLYTQIGQLKVEIMIIKQP